MNVLNMDHSLVITTVAEQMDNIPSKAGLAQLPNFAVTKTSYCKGSGADNIQATGRGKQTL